MHPGGHAPTRGASAGPFFLGGKILDTAHIDSVFQSGMVPGMGNCSFGFRPQLCLLG